VAGKTNKRVRTRAKDRGWKPTRWVAELPLARMVEWLADLLRDKYEECQEIPLHSPLNRLGSH